jgi:hypothetical protein
MMNFSCAQPTINLLQLDGLRCGTEGKKGNAYACKRKREKVAKIWIYNTVILGIQGCCLTWVWDLRYTGCLQIYEAFINICRRNGLGPLRADFFLQASWQVARVTK